MSRLKTIFGAILSTPQILDKAEDLEYYGHDSCKEFAPHASLILLPDSHEQVLGIVRACNTHQIPLVPSGGRSGYSAGATATAGEVVISLARMSRILELNSVERTLRCQAGVTTEAARVAAQSGGMYYPVDFTSKGSSHIGGNIATNAGGIRVIRYGNTRDWVLGLTVVTGGGEELRLNGPLFKNQTGYDLRGVFIGSEGTLGVITEATLKLTNPPGEVIVILAALNETQAALASLERFRAKNLLVNVFEYFEHSGLELVLEYRPQPRPFAAAHPGYLLIEIENADANTSQLIEGCLEELIADGILVDAVVGQNSKHTSELFALRELIGEAANKIRVAHKNDISIPVSRLPEFVDKVKQELVRSAPAIEVIIFGHVGDGNLHLNTLKPSSLPAAEFFGTCRSLDEQIFAIVQELGGSISAEHGVGLLKKPYLHYSRSSEEIALMKGMKKLFDPRGILNPGKIF